MQSSKQSCYLSFVNHPDDWGTLSITHLIGFDADKLSLIEQFVELMKGDRDDLEGYICDGLHVQIQSLSPSDLESANKFSLCFNLFVDDTMDDTDYNKIETMVKDGKHISFLKIYGCYGSKVGSTRFDLEDD